MGSSVPGYVGLALAGSLDARAATLEARLSSCDLCPRICGVDRARTRGACRTGLRAGVGAAVPHRGEEPVISGTKGSGGLFLTGCNLACRFCQNHQISQSASPTDREVDAQGLADAMLSLQAAGCHNVNVVSGSHVVPQVLRGLAEAARRGLVLPLVWNSNAYERVNVLRALDGVVDVYLPDLKYGADGMAWRLSGVRGYVAASRAALREMARQVGPLAVDEEGLARRGLIVRHLVLPNNAAGTASCLRFVATHLPQGVGVSLMAQYAPDHVAAGDPIVGRRLRPDEYERAVALLEDLGLETGWVQSLEESPDHYRPDFRATHPFERD